MRLLPRRLRSLRILQCRSTETIRYWDYVDGRKQLASRKIRCERPLHFGRDHW